MGSYSIEIFKGPCKDDINSDCYGYRVFKGGILIADSYMEYGSEDEAKEEAEKAIKQMRETGVEPILTKGISGKCVNQYTYIVKTPGR